MGKINEELMKAGVMQWLRDPQFREIVPGRVDSVETAPTYQ
jgi:hypothetical protein